MWYTHLINMQYIHIYRQNTYWRNNKDERRLLLKKNIPLTLKGLCVRGSWRLNKDCNILTSPAPPDIAVCRSRSPGLLNRWPGGPASLGHVLIPASSHQLVWSPNWLPVFTELYNSSIAHSISLEWHVWSSSSGNNCHAVLRSLSSGASVYDCTMGFYLVPYCQPSPPLRFLPITAIGMCHFLPVHHFGMACLAGSEVNIQHIDLINVPILQVLDWFIDFLLWHVNQYWVMLCLKLRNCIQCMFIFAFLV